jgi:uncharacterized membrane protein YqjE
MQSVNSEIHGNGRSVADILSDMKGELSEFVQTRVAMFRAELREKWNAARVAIPLAGFAILSLFTAFLLFSGALVGLVLVAFPHSLYRWFFACAIVAIFWVVLGGVAAYFAKREFELASMAPKRTLEVLKGDKLWIQAEVKNRI